MKKLVLLSLALCFTATLIQAQKTQTKRKELVYGSDYGLVKVETYIDGKLDKQQILLEATNTKNPSDLELKSLIIAAPEDVKLVMDSALRFLDLAAPGATTLFNKVQFYVPPVVTDKSLLIIVSDYDTYHAFRVIHLKEMQKALAKFFEKK